MNEYQKAKQRARDKAVEWQTNFCEQNYSWGELAHYTEYFNRIARSYGLVTEFRENGII